MAVKEQNRFSIGRIGVANADRSGEILNRSIADNAAQIIKTIEPLAKEQALRRGQEEAEAVETQFVTGIDPQTGLPKAYRQDNFQIDNQVFNEIIKKRFKSEIVKEIKIAAEDANTQTLNSPNRLQAFTTRLNSRLSAMSENAKGWAKQFIDSNGADYLAQTAKSIERQVAAQARQDLIVDSIEGIQDKINTVTSLAKINDTFSQKKYQTLQKDIEEDIKELRSQNLITAKQEIALIQRNKIAPKAVSFSSTIYNESVFDDIIGEQGDIENGELLKLVLNYAFDSPDALDDAIQTLKQNKKLNFYGRELEKLTKGLSNNEISVLGATLKEKNAITKSKINSKYGREQLQVIAEDQANVELNEFIGNMRDDPTNLFNNFNQFSDQLRNIFKKPYITNTFRDRRLEEGINLVLFNEFEKAFGPIYRTGRSTQALLDATIKYVSSDPTISKKEFEETILQLVPKEKLKNLQNLRNQIPNLKSNLVGIGYMDSFEPTYNIFDGLTQRYGLKKQIGTDVQQNQTQRNISLIQTKLRYNKNISNTPANRDILSQNALLMAQAANMLSEGANEDDLKELYLRDVNYFADSQPWLTELDRDVPINTATQSILNNLANGLYRGERLLNALQIYGQVRQKNYGDGKMHYRFANKGGPIKEDIFATLEQLHVFKQGYSDNEIDSMLDDYVASFSDITVAQSLARKIDVSPTDTKVIKKVDDKLTALVTDYLSENYSPVNIGLMTKVVKARARGLLLQPLNNTVNSFEAIHGDIDKFINEVFPENLGVLYDPILRQRDLHSQQSPILQYGGEAQAIKAINKIQKKYTDEKYIKYFEKYHKGFVPSFDINSVKEKDLMSGGFFNMVGRTVEYVAKGATLLNLPAALVNADYLLDMDKSFKLNVLAALGLEDKAKEIGHSFMLYPVNVDSDNFEYRIMVRNYTGNDYYFLPEVDSNGEPLQIPVQFNPNEYKEEEEKIEEEFSGSKSYVDPISSMIMQTR
tara:strand:- start:5002 stop:7959 length:2958 start_codon:yes stop_codon:yes gene_type:complete